MPRFVRRVHRFLGREGELDRLQQLFEGGTPAISVVGPPGAGKTTVVARWLQQTDLASSGWRVLALVSDGDPKTLAAEVLDMLGVSAGGDVVEAAGEELARIPTVLVLDDLMLDPESAGLLGAVLDRWLANAAELHVVTASRRRLGIRGEAIIELSALPAPQARALLLECVGDLSADLRHKAERDPRLDALLAGLGGLPLAIELAAARANLLSVEAMAERAGRGELLGDVMDASVAATLEALPPSTARVFAALSVFEGEFDAEAAIEVAPTTLDELSSIRNASLVHTRFEGDDIRLSLLPPIRGSARRLLGDGARDRLQARHTAWVLGCARASGGRLESGDWHRGFVELGKLLPDLDAALERTVEKRDPRAAELLVWVDRARRVHGGRSRLIPIIDALLEMADLWTPTERLELLMRRTELGLREMRPAEVHGALERAADAFPSFREDERWQTCHQLVELLRRPNEHGILEDAVALAKRTDEKLERVLRSWLIEAYRERGRTAEALEQAEHVLSTEEPHGRASALTGLAYAALEGQDFARAERYAEEGFQCLAMLPVRPARTHQGLTAVRGRLAQARGDLQLSLSHYRAASQGTDPMMRVMATGAAASVLVQTGRLTQARDELRSETSAMRRWSPAYGALFTVLLGALEARLGSLARARVELDRLATDVLPLFVQVALSDARRLVQEVDAPGSVDGPTQPSSPVIEATLVRDLLLAQIEKRPLPGLRIQRLRLARTGEWFEAGVGRVPCGRRPVMRRLMVALVEARLESPGRSLDREELLAIGWDGERMQARSAKRRLEVMISRMRQAGLEDALETTDGGYRIHPSCQVNIEDA